MGFNLSAFGAGFATAAAKDIQEEQKLAELRGAEAVKNMQINYKTVTEENKKREAELVGNIDLLRTYDPTATEAELFAISTKPSVMAAISDLVKKDAFDPASFKVSNFAKVAENNVTSTALERVKLLSVMPNLAKDTIAKEVAPSGNILKDLIGSNAARSQEKAMLQYAEASGIPLERLKAAQAFIRPKAEAAVDIDMSKLRPIQKKFSEIEDAAKLELFKARESGDPAAIVLATKKLANLAPEKKFSALEDDAKLGALKARESGDPVAIDLATKKLANVVAVNAETSVKDKTEAQIQTEMINNIQRFAKAGDGQAASTEAALLRQRQSLERLPTKEGKTDADKITQANKIQVASKALLAAVQDSLPPGSFITVTDREGNVSTELKDLTQAPRYDAGVAAGRQQMINRFTVNGKPKGEAEQNALASIGVQFDDKGIAFVPKVERPATERRNSTAAPSGGGRLGSAPSGRTAPAAAPRAAAPTAAPSLVWDTRTNSWVTP